jgi:hypothetical protein
MLHGAPKLRYGFGVFFLPLNHEQDVDDLRPPGYTAG